MRHPLVEKPAAAVLAYVAFVALMVYGHFFDDNLALGFSVLVGGHVFFGFAVGRWSALLLPVLMLLVVTPFWGGKPIENSETTVFKAYLFFGLASEIPNSIGVLVRKAFLPVGG